MKRTYRIKIIVFILMFAACGMIVGIGGERTSATQRVKLNKTSITLNKGFSFQLKLSGAKGKLIWKSSKKSVADVNKKGKITGRKKGSTQISVKHGKKTYKCKVIVESPSINLNSVVLDIGSTKKLSIFGTRQKIDWYSNDQDVVSISKSGVAKANGGGKTEIIGRIDYKGSKSKYFYCKVTVNNVKLVIPNTIGAKGCPENRMKIMSYNFGRNSSDYYLNISMKLIHYGRTYQSGWSSEVLYYDSNGKIISDDTSFFFVDNLVLNKTYDRKLIIPPKTAKIVFQEYYSKQDEDAYLLAKDAYNKLKFGSVLKFPSTLVAHSATAGYSDDFYSGKTSVVLIEYSAENNYGQKMRHYFYAWYNAYGNVSYSIEDSIPSNVYDTITLSLEEII